MADEPTIGTQEPVSKSPITRLLDLTLGWAEYVAEREDQYPDIVSFDELFWLYQSVAGFSESVWDGTAEEQAVMVRRFVEEHLMPILLRRK